MTVVTTPPDFVGREAELAALASVLGRVRDGRGGLAVVVGEPGIGKTALVEVAAAACGCRTVWARAREEAGAPPLWLWQQALRANGDLAEAGRRGPEQDLAPPIDAASLTGTGQDRFRRFDEITRLLVAPALVEPYVIVLDDLQWADSESLALLDFLVPDIADVPLVVLATARTGEVERLPRSDLVLELEGLVPVELRQLLARHVGGRVSDELVAVVGRHTGGSPFFVGEVVRLLRASGRIEDAEQWQRALPAGVRAVVARRLARLPQAARESLAAASVIGVEVDASLLGAILGIGRVEAYDSLAPAVAAGLLRDSGDGRFVFSHALVREAVSAGLGAGLRRALHEQVAMALEASGDVATAAPIIATHWRAAGEAPRAARWSELAGEMAYREAMYAEAVAWLTAAVAANPAPSPATLVRLADAQSRCGLVAEASAGYLSAAHAARACGDVRSLARAALGTGTMGGGFEVALLDPAQLGLLTEALEALEALGTDVDQPERAVLLARLSVASTLQSEPAVRADLAEGAVAMARRLRHDGALAYALSAWCDAHAGPHDLDARLAASAEMLVVARRAADPELELLARRFLIVGRMERGDVALAARDVEAFAMLADSLRQPQFCWYARLAEGMLALLRGDLSEAERLGRQASELGRQAQSSNARMLADGALLPMVAREGGRSDYLVEIERVNREHPESARGLDVAALFGVGYGVDRDAVRRALTDLSAAVVPPDDGLYILAMALMGNGGAYVLDEAVMAAAYAALLPYADRLVLDGTAAVCYGPVSATLARIAAARGATDEARHWSQHATQMLRRVGARLILERVEQELATLTASQEATREPVPSESDANDRGRHDRSATLIREGDVWLVSFDGASARLRHSKGLLDLAALVAVPGREVHVLDLVAVGEGRAAGSAAADATDLGPALDAQARAAYEQRVRDLTEDIEEAEAHHDIERAAALDDERAALLEALADALGLSGRRRPQGSDTERARKAVGMRLRETISRIERDVPALGHHLRHAVRMGTFCAYRAEHPVDWRCHP